MGKERLDYKTRGYSDLHGKEYVYFSCHPDDFDRYFDTICHDIFATQNCAVWYNTKPQENWDEKEMLILLKQMQLFVIPVTNKFLFQDNISREKELYFALDNNIPVLPLIQEENLSTDFNQICGNLQCLDKTANSKDPTAIPYEEKLERFLSAVLLGDEIVSEIKKSFAAHIFMSYRKKDRKYAKELMKNIHKNNFCRDIAIWYDEFLTLGEEFDVAIESEIKECSLFTVLVTPNLLERNNYVVTEEYPIAKKMHKPMLFAEMEYTDKTELDECFGETLPTLVNARNAGALENALLESLEDLNNTEIDSSPNHLYLIGMAYLNGIDVEEDKERGVELIKKASEENSIEAMNQLALMYLYGVGVDRDYRQSIEWLKKIVKYWWNKCAASQLKDDYEELIDAMMHLDSVLILSYDLNDSKDLNNKALLMLDEKKEQFGETWYITYALQFYDNLSSIYRKEEKLNEAEKNCRKGKELCEKLAKDTNTKESWEKVINCYLDLGQINLDRKGLSKAKEYFMEAEKLARSIYQDIETEKAQETLIYISYNLGSILLNEDELTEAENYLKKGLEMSDRTVDEERSFDALKNVMVGDNYMGELFLKREDYTNARKWYQKGLEINQLISDSVGDINSQDNLISSYNCLGNVSVDEKEYKDARNWYRKGLDLSEKINNDIGTVSSRTTVAVNYGNYANAWEKEGDKDQAKIWYQKSINIFKELVSESEKPEPRKYLAKCYRDFASILIKDHDIVGATENFRKALDLFKLLKLETGTVESENDLAYFYYNFGEVCMNYKSYKNAKQLFQEALSSYEEIKEETGTVESEKSVIGCRYHLVCVDIAENNIAKAKEVLQKVIKSNEKLNKKFGTLQSLWDLIRSYNTMGFIYMEKENNNKSNLLKAKEYFLKTISLNGYWNDNKAIIKTLDCEIFAAYYNLAFIYIELKDLKNAEESFLNILSMSKKLGFKNISEEARKILLGTYSEISTIYIVEKNFKDAEEICQMGIELKKSLSFQACKEKGDLIANIYQNMANIYIYKKEYDKAKQMYEEVLRLRIDFCKDYPSDENYDKLASNYLYAALASISSPDQKMLSNAAAIWISLLEKNPNNSSYKEKLQTVMAMMK